MRNKCSIFSIFYVRHVHEKKLEYEKYHVFDKKLCFSRIFVCLVIEKINIPFDLSANAQKTFHAFHYFYIPSKVKTNKRGNEFSCTARKFLLKDEERIIFLFTFVKFLFWK